MFCSSLRIVVYSSSRPIARATYRTVLGPFDHSTRRMATSALVGFGFRPVRDSRPIACYSTTFIVHVNTIIVVHHGSFLTGRGSVSRDADLHGSEWLYRIND